MKCDSCNSRTFAEIEDADGNTRLFCVACGKDVEYDPLENDPPMEED